MTFVSCVRSWDLSSVQGTRLTLLPWLFLTVLNGLSLPACSAEPISQLTDDTFRKNVTPFLVKYCQECHSSEVMEAEINLESFQSLADLRKEERTWQKVAEMLHSGQMPPKDAPQPTTAERDAALSWVQQFLKHEAEAHAGDPGRVVLRRLSNAEYTYTLRDLTGVTTLNPAAEFPGDGAAGEGFTNTGSALVMSPALLTKYLDAAKEISEHVVFLPDGFRFSPHTTRRDHTDEMLAKIRDFYGRYTESRTGEKVNLQGIVFDTNGDGGLPLASFLRATLEERESLRTGTKTIQQVAEERGLNQKYLNRLWTELNASSPSPVLDPNRSHWRAAGPEDVPALISEIGAWQSGLWKFSPVGQIGKVNGPKRWQEPVTPLATAQELRYKIPVAADGQPLTIALITTDAGDGHEHDQVIWENPRLVAPGRPELPLREVRDRLRDFATRRQQVVAETAKCLDAVDFASKNQVDVPTLAQERGISVDALTGWMNYLGIGKGPTEVHGHFTTQLHKVSGKDFINGWGTEQTPLILANSSDTEAHIPGYAAPHSIVVHPSPTLAAAVAWRSTVEATVTIEGHVQHVHAACGNGVTWSLELRKGGTRQTLGTGATSGAAPVRYGPFQNIPVRPGDVVALLIGSRDGNHSCDLTGIDLTVSDTAGTEKTRWNLTDDVAGNILASNPLPDRHGHVDVWHFFTENQQGNPGIAVPPGSLLASWQLSTTPLEKQQLADQVQALLSAPLTVAAESPDAMLYRELMTFDGPLFRSSSWRNAGNQQRREAVANANDASWGLPPEMFGKSATGASIGMNNLSLSAPSIVQFQLPADLATGYELVATGRLDTSSNSNGSVRFAVTAGQQGVPLGLSALKDVGNVPAASAAPTAAAPIVIADGGAGQASFMKAFDEFRELFPIAICYPKIVPVDEVVTLTLFYREDDALCRLMLNEAEQAQLDRYWEELHFISQDALTQVDVFLQLMEYASQDADPSVFEPLRQPFLDQAANFRQALLGAEPRQLAELMKFAAQAYRRPLRDQEESQLRQLYAALRLEELSHTEAFKLTLAKILMSPDFLYHVEVPGPGTQAGPVSDWELASRLSYFLWSSKPDAELLQLAAAGKLHEPEVLSSQTSRMLADPRTRRLATEFACQWLHIYEFDQLDEKSEQYFPEFAAIRGDMYEESIRFFQDLFQQNGSVLEILNADHTFLNENLARHYGIPGVTGPEWRRVDGIKERHRGGILAQATTLTKQSGASRTSPTLRGSWISEVLLGERLPRPPKDVPVLPDDPNAFAGLTVRQIVEKHASDARCAVCHVRVDPMGFSLEAYDAIGRHREKDMGDLPLETDVVMQDGTAYTGLDGLRDYLTTVRRDAFVRQFCKKLLGYALGRSVQLSDEPLLARMQSRLKADNYRVQLVIEEIVHSPQFLQIRGRDVAEE